MAEIAQYDGVGSNYLSVENSPDTALQMSLVLDVLGDVKGLSVLDLACGTGLYSRLLIDSLQARRVVGVDISSAMIKTAQDAGTRDGKIQYHVSDCADPSMPTRLGLQASFDVVLACWLLNYGDSKEAVTNMFDNVAKCLKSVDGEGGVGAGDGRLRFVSLMPDPFLEFPKDGSPIKTVGCVMQALPSEPPLPDGYKVRVTLPRVSPPFEFDEYHLRPEVYEQAAREAGFQKFAWQRLSAIPKSLAARFEGLSAHSNVGEHAWFVAIIAEKSLSHT